MTTSTDTTSTPELETTTTTGTTGEGTAEQSDWPTIDLSLGGLLTHKGKDNKRYKAMRILLTGRLLVKRVDADAILADVRGDSGKLYTCGWRTDKQRWGCTCPARTDCSHLMALWAVTAVER